MRKTCAKPWDNARKTSRKICVHSSTVLRASMAATLHMWVTNVSNPRVYRRLLARVSTAKNMYLPLLNNYLPPLSTVPTIIATALKKKERV